MIISKPKVSTLFSLGLFISICLGIAGYSLHYMLDRSIFLWYLWLIIVILAPVALGLLAKVILGYKVVKLGKNQFHISYPARFSNRIYNLKQVNFWKEQIVKTRSGAFKELNLKFEDEKKLSLSLQEHTKYDEVINYLKKRCAKKQQHD